MKARLPLLSLLLLLVLAAPATARVAVLERSNGEATISGTVTGHGKPLPDVRVSVMDLSTFVSDQAYTGEDGTYAIPGMTPGRKRVRFRTDDDTLVGEYYANSPTTSGATTVTLADGDVRDDINADLEDAGTISGVVKTTGGTPIAGVTVTATYGTLSASARSRGDGTYTLQTLRAGSYRLRFSADAGVDLVPEYYDDAADAGDATYVPVTAGVDTPNINAQLSAGGHITGHVTGAGESSGAGTQATALRNGFEYASSATVDAKGDYDIASLGTGSYVVCFSPPQDSGYYDECYDDEDGTETADRIAVTAGSTHGSVDAVLSHGGRVEGKVTDITGAGVANAFVDLYRGNQKIVGLRADAEGTYSLSTPGSGDYTVCFRPASGENLLRECYDDAADHFGADTLSVKRGVVTSDINAVLDAPSSISGVVTGQGAGGLGGIRVEARSLTSNETFSADTAADGSYTVEGVRGGSYLLSFSPPTGSAYLPESFDDVRSDEDATPVTVAKATTKSGVNAQLARGGAISGTVTDAAGKPVADTHVGVTLKNGYSAEARTDGDGHYTVAGLDGGDYEVSFSAPPESGLANEYYRDRATAVKADAVPVVVNTVVEHIDASLEQVGGIAGRVTGTGGTALTGVDVRVYDVASRQILQELTTDEDGHYAGTGFKPGRVKLQFVPGADGYLGEYYADARGLASAGAVTIPSGAVKTDVDAELTRGGTLRGTVLDAAGDPVADLSVSAKDAAGHDGFDYTDEGGHYEITGLQGGQYVVGTDGNADGEPAFYPDARTADAADPVPVATGQVVEGIDLKLRPRAVISGRVLLSDAAAGAYVDILDADGKRLFGANTDEDGVFEAKVASGTYRVRFQPFQNDFAPEFYNDAVTLAAAVPVTVGDGGRKDLGTITVSPPGSIAGTVTGPGGPLEDAEVKVYDAQGMEVRQTRTDADGVYRVTGFATGAYRVSASSGDLARVYTGGKPTLAEATPVDVTAPGTTSGVDLALTAGGHITGAVTGPGGKPVRNAGVVAYEATSATVVARAGTQKNGTYRLDGLGSTGYRIQFQAPSDKDQPPEYLSEFYDDQPTLDAATAVPVTAGATHSGVNAQLAGIPTFSGTITDAEGAPVSDADVTLYDAAGKQVVQRRTYTTGTFTITAPPGTYRLGVTADDFDPEFFDNSSTLAGAKAITVAAGDKVTADIVLQVLGSAAAGSDPVPAETASPAPSVTATPTATATATATTTVSPARSPVATPVPIDTAPGTYVGKRKRKVTEGRLAVDVVCGARGCAAKLFAYVGAKRHRHRLLIGSALAGPGGGRLQLILTRAGRKLIARHPARVRLSVAPFGKGATNGYTLVLRR